MDSRIERLAEIVVEQACKIGKRDYVQIIGQPESKELVLAVFEKCLKKGAFPTTKIIFNILSYLMYIVQFLSSVGTCNIYRKQDF